MDDVYLRALTPEDFQIFRTLRLRALADNLDNYRGDLQADTSRPDSDWEKTLGGDGRRVFGLFDRNILIGLTGIFTSGEDPSGQTGVLAMSYIEPAYRRRHLSDLFFKARFAFAVQHLPWNFLTVSHRRGNEASRCAILRHGFILTGTRQAVWSDGARDKEFMYILDLKAMRAAF